MKKLLFTMLMALCATTIMAKDWKTVVVTTTPQMHCEGCENKIKGNLKFVKGIKNVQTNIEEQKVTIQYDEKKTDEATIVKAFEKFGYNAQVITTCEQPAAECPVASPAVE